MSVKELEAAFEAACAAADAALSELRQAEYDLVQAQQKVYEATLKHRRLERRADKAEAAMGEVEV